MNKPKLILLDYGNTIITETIHGFDKGNEALVKTAVKNPQNITITELQAKADEVITGISKRMGCTNRFYQPYELSWASINRYIYEKTNYYSFSADGGFAVNRPDSVLVSWRPL